MPRTKKKSPKTKTKFGRPLIRSKASRTKHCTEMVNCK